MERTEEKIENLTRYMAVGLAVVESIAMAIGLVEARTYWMVV